MAQSKITTVPYVAYGTFHICSAMKAQVQYLPISTRPLRSRKPRTEALYSGVILLGSANHPFGGWYMGDRGANI